jgi:hypothetical protein
MFTANKRYIPLMLATALSGVVMVPGHALAARRPPTTTTTNLNLDEWNLIALTTTDVTSANGGSGVTVAVLDGLTDCRHADLTGRCTNVKLTGGTYSGYDKHGTHTAGSVAGAKYGVAIKANVVNYGVFDSFGWVASGTKLIDAWRNAGTRGATIASMSFGCTGTALCFTADEVRTMADPTLAMLYVKAAGNDGAILANEAVAVDSATASAAMGRTILVGSVNLAGTISTFSNRPGTGCLLPTGATTCASDQTWQNHFIVAPGENIYSTLPNNSYGYMSGTSMATPIVAGAAALLEARWPALKTTPEKVAQILFTTATDKGTVGVDAVYGWGLLNVAKAFQAQGNVVMQTSSGGSTTLTGTTLSLSPAFSALPTALGGITVYDKFGRDFSLAETGALRVRTNMLGMRQMLGRRLLGQGEQYEWAQQFFAERPVATGFAMFGSPADASASMMMLDRTTRMGVDLPFKGFTAQLRMTGAGSTRTDFAYDPTMKPLSFFASTGLLDKSMIANALIPLSDHSRLMVYGTTTTGGFEARPAESPLALRLTDDGFTPRFAFSKNPVDRHQTGIGIGYWTRPDSRTVVGFNVSAINQTGGYYNLASDISAFDKPTRLFNFGAMASRLIGGFELVAAGEMTHLRMATGADGLRFTPANMVSGELSLRKNGIAFAGRQVRDNFGLAFVVPPRAISGNLRLDYLVPTTDGLGRQSARYLVPLSQLGSEPARVEAAYRVSVGKAMSFSLSGGANLSNAAMTGAGEVMAGMKMSF